MIEERDSRETFGEDITMKRKVSALIFCLLLLLVSCKQKSAEPKIETANGVIFVHNPAIPLLPDRAVSFEEEFTLKEKDEAGEIRLFKPGRYIIDEKDEIYISDESDTAIKVFDAQGKYLRTIGRKGDGPGEFEMVGDMTILPDGRLLVTDYQARRTSFFSPDGQFLSSFQWKKFFARIYLATSSSCTLSETTVSEQGTELWVKTIDFNGEEIGSFGKFTFPEMKRLQLGDGMIATSVPWTPSSVFAGDRKNQWLYHCLNDKYLIEVYGQQGKLIRKIERPYEPVPVTDEDINKIKARFADRPDSPGAKLYAQMEFPKVKPVAERLLVDSEANLWVETNEEKKEGEKSFRAYDIFNPDGFYEARVWSELTPGSFANGKMFRLAEDDQTGMRVLKRYRVVWGEAAK
jgi:hypothetical protein